MALMRPQIMLFGDSITEVSFRLGGWGASLANTYVRRADIVNRGFAGYNTTWGLIMLQHLFLLDAPTHVIATTIFFGANDAALLGRSGEKKHVPLDEYKENLRKMIQHLKKCSPSMLILMITPPPIDEEGRMESERKQGKPMLLPERTLEESGKYAKKCVELAGELGLPSINLWSKMQETQGWQKKFLSDGIHLTPEGNAVVYQEVMKAFNATSLAVQMMPTDGVSKLIGNNTTNSTGKAFQQEIPV